MLVGASQRPQVGRLFPPAHKLHPPAHSHTFSAPIATHDPQLCACLYAAKVITCMHAAHYVAPCGKACLALTSARSPSLSAAKPTRCPSANKTPQCHNPQPADSHISPLPQPGAQKHARTRTRTHACARTHTSTHTAAHTTCAHSNHTLPLRPVERSVGRLLWA